MEDRVLRVFPALLHQAFGAAARVFDEAVAVAIAVALDPFQRVQDIRPDRANELGIARAAVIRAGQSDEQWRGVGGAVVAAERYLARARHFAAASLVQNLARLAIALGVLDGCLGRGEKREHADVLLPVGGDVTDVEELEHDAVVRVQRKPGRSRDESSRRLLEHEEAHQQRPKGSASERRARAELDHCRGEKRWQQQREIGAREPAGPHDRESLARVQGRALPGPGLSRATLVPSPPQKGAGRLLPGSGVSPVMLFPFSRRGGRGGKGVRAP